MAIFYLLTFLVCGAYLGLMLVCLAGWRRTPVFTANSPAFPPVRVSVIIPARNEAGNILRCLDGLRNQNYPKEHMEIILVDDHSTDATLATVCAQQIPNLSVISLPEGSTGKKQAISAGIERASGTLIITTDADCSGGAGWVSAIASFYAARRPRMIVAPVLQEGNDGSILQSIQSQEMLALTSTACASLYYDSPLLCSGANIAYEKAAFESVHGYEGVDHIASGDDMFLMFKMHQAYPGRIRYLKSPEAAVFTGPAPDTGSFLAQRNRWASKTFRYGFRAAAAVAVLVFLANFLILLSGILSVINVKFAYALIATISLKGLADYMLINSASSFFKKKQRPLLFTFAFLVYPAYVSLVGITSSFNPYSWKGRKS